MQKLKNMMNMDRNFNATLGGSERPVNGLNDRFKQNFNEDAMRNSATLCTPIYQEQSDIKN
jgi:hypothetical protein